MFIVIWRQPSSDWLTPFGTCRNNKNGCILGYCFSLKHRCFQQYIILFYVYWLNLIIYLKMQLSEKSDDSGFTISKNLSQISQSVERLRFTFHPFHWQSVQKGRSQLVTIFTCLTRRSKKVFLWSLNPRLWAMFCLTKVVNQSEESIT